MAAKGRDGKVAKARKETETRQSCGRAGAAGWGFGKRKMAKGFKLFRLQSGWFLVNLVLRTSGDFLFFGLF